MSRLFVSVLEKSFQDGDHSRLCPGWGRADRMCIIVEFTDKREGLRCTKTQHQSGHAAMYFFFVNKKRDCVSSMLIPSRATSRAALHLLLPDRPRGYVRMDQLYEATGCQ